MQSLSSLDAYFVHRRAPEVVEENVLEWSVLPQVAVILDCRNVVKHKATVECVVVAQDGDQRDGRAINV